MEKRNRLHSYEFAAIRKTVQKEINHQEQTKTKIQFYI